MEAPVEHRFYGELADVVAAHLADPRTTPRKRPSAPDICARRAIPVREVLELGSGGGSNAVHLKASFAMTLVDLVRRRCSPCPAGSTRSASTTGATCARVRLGRQFDAVFVHDAVDYMLTEDDLRAAMATAFVHCRPGGVALFVPDDTRETFAPGTDHGGDDGPDGRAARYLEWTLGSRSRRHVDRPPSTPSCCATPTARSASPTRRTARACSAATSGCGCSPPSASSRAPSSRRPPRTARPASCSSATAAR